MESPSLETDAQKLSGHDPLQLAVADLLEPSVGPDDLQRCLPIPAVLQFRTVLSGMHLFIDFNPSLRQFQGDVIFN